MSLCWAWLASHFFASCRVQCSLAMFLVHSILIGFSVMRQTTTANIEISLFLDERNAIDLVPEAQMPFVAVDWSEKWIYPWSNKKRAKLVRNRRKKTEFTLICSMQSTICAGQSNDIHFEINILIFVPPAPLVRHTVERHGFYSGDK